MVTPSTSSPHPPSEESVQPSSALIDEFHRRLLNPGVVSAFEQEHRREESQNLTERVVRPRWLLHAANGGSDCSVVAANVHDVKHHHDIKTKCFTNDTKSGDERYINGIPKRNYIDLRMEQNRMFADDQSSKCHDILSTIKVLHDQSSHKKKLSLSSNINDNNDNELEKHTKLLHTLLHEGLSACPNHVGLLEVQTNYAEWHKGNVEMLDLENITDDTSTKSTINLPLRRNGLERRAHAAMSDVLTERSFLTYGGGDDGDATMIKGYSLLPPTAVDEHHGESSRNESPPGKDHKQRRRKHDRRRRSRSSKDDRSSKRMRRIEYDQLSSPLLHDRHHRHRRRSQSCESSGSNRSEISRSSSYTHSSSSSSYSRRRRRQHRKEKKSRMSSKSKAKKSKKSKHHYCRKSRSCDATGDEEGNNDVTMVKTLEEASI